MEVYVPAYYTKFHCIDSTCPDSCCKEWCVDVDEQSAQYYRLLPGSLGDRLRRFLRETEEGTVLSLENGRCPMWRQDGLCDIQAQLGHDALCRVCRQFPRLRHDYGSFVELGLEMSCPEAARLILAEKSTAMTVQSVPGGDPPEYDRFTMEILLRTRGEFTTFLDQTAYSLPHILAIFLLYAHRVQAELDGGEEATLVPANCLEAAQKYAASENLTPLQPFFSNLEILTPQWSTMLAHPAAAPVWAPELRALLRYLIQRYWLQAVSDFDIVCRTKFIVSACLLVAASGAAPEVSAQLFSKEIENDPDNMEAILEAAYCHPAFTDRNLLGMLLF